MTAAQNDRLTRSAAGAGEPAPADYPSRWAALIVVVAAQFMVLLDSTIVNVAVPSIRTSLTATTVDLQWIVDAYIMFFGGLLLLGGRLADLFGRRRMFLVGLTVFALASLVCGVAGDPGTLIAARAFQGAGAALLSPAALSIVVTMFRDPGERRTALSVWGGTAVLGGTLGVVLGGLLVDGMSWRWAFLLNIPIAVAAFAMAVVIVPPLRRAAGALRRTLDLPGAVLATGALLALVYGLIGAAEDGWRAASTLVALAVAVVLLAGLVAVELRTRDPLMPMRLFAAGPLVLGGVGLLLTWAGQISVFFLVSVYQQDVLGFNALQAGLGMLSLGVPALLSAVLLPRLMGRFRPAGVYVAGALLVLLGTLALTQLPHDGRFLTDLLPGLVIMGLGLPCCFVPLTTMGVSAVAPADSGIASGLLNTLSQTGAALGIAVLVSLATTRAEHLTADGSAVPIALAAGIRFGFVAASVVAAISLALAVINRFVASNRRPGQGSTSD